MSRAIAYAAYAATSSVRYISQGSLRYTSIGHDLPKISIQSSLGSSERWRMRRRGPPDLRPIPEGVCEPICIRKKCKIWARWRPVLVKNVNYSRPPSSRRSGLVGPYTTPPIVNYNCTTSTPREMYFEAARRQLLLLLIWTSSKSIGDEKNDRVQVQDDGKSANGRRSK